jgi:hypothetical protein
MGRRALVTFPGNVVLLLEDSVGHVARKIIYLVIEL